MAETVSDRDVEQARNRVEKLREQIAEEKSKASVIANEGANAVRIAGLEREESDLKVELAKLKEANKPKVVREALADATEPAPVPEPEALVDPDQNEVK